MQNRGTIFSPGDPADAVFQVLEGRIRLPLPANSLLSVLVDQRVLGGDVFLSGEIGAGVEQDLQGEFRDLFALDLAVDHSGGRNDGTVYQVWDDGRNCSISDIAAIESVNQNAPFITGGTYASTDIFIRRSAYGVSFTPATQVNRDHQPSRGRSGHDHFQPAIAVDSTGRVEVCWYDRRNDPKNFNIERFCAVSENGGAHWKESRIKGTTFAPDPSAGLPGQPRVHGEL